MSLSTVRLDDRSHAELVAEARRRVAVLCPELAVNGGADPTAALIELFTWMTGLAVERLAMVPDKLHVALLDLLGIELDGPAAARTELRMRLSAPPAEPLEIRAGTEAGTLRTPAQESIVFGTVETFTIHPLLPAAYLVQRAGAAKEIGVADGVAYPTGPDQVPFSRQPQHGDALYLGFDGSLSRLLMRVSMEASMARGAGVKPDDPPLRWEMSRGDNTWAEVDVLEDLTGGFNYGSGTVEVQCPPGSGTEAIAGRRLYWLRCRIAETTRVAGEPAVYTQAPEIYQITAAPIGALLPAEHATVEIEEMLGVSDGSPSQTFATRFAPVLSLVPGETLEVKTGEGDWEPWEQRDSFAGSGPGIGTSAWTWSTATSASDRSCARPTGASRCTGRSPPRAPCCACAATATAAAGPATSTAGRSTCCAAPSPAWPRCPIRDPRSAAWTPRGWTRRAGARRCRSAPATAR